MNKQEIDSLFFLLKYKYRKPLGKSMLNDIYKVLSYNIPSDKILEKLWYSKPKQTFKYYLTAINQVKEDCLTHNLTSANTNNENIARIQTLINQIMKG